MMELGARELLITLGALVILVILVDGVRRVRNAKYDRIRVSRRKQPIFDNDGLDEFGSELPNGGARVVSYRDELDPEEAQEIIRKAAEAGKPKLSIQAKSAPEQRSLSLGDAPPVLMDPVDGDDCKDVDDANSKSASANKTGGQQRKSAKAATKPVAKAGQQKASTSKGRSTANAASKPPSTSKSSAQTQADKPEAEPPNPEMVMVFHLMARKGQLFEGPKLLDALLAQGMRYGSMKIFHRHAELDGSGPILFSLANTVEPGTFDLDAMTDFTTPGVSFFITLDSQDSPTDAFGTLLDTISALVEQLDGELKDETRSAVTRQTIEHYWQRVREFERRVISESI